MRLYIHTYSQTYKCKDDKYTLSTWRMVSGRGLGIYRLSRRFRDRQTSITTAL